MTPTTPLAFHTRFVFSLAPILPDLQDDARSVAKQLSRDASETVTTEDVLIAWVMFQLERHLFLNLEMSPQRIRAHRLTLHIPPPFLHNFAEQRDLLIAQIQPVLLRGHESPYTERFCRVEIRLPDLKLYFL